MDPNPYIITYGSKFMSNYLTFLHTDLLYKDLLYMNFTYRFISI